MHLSDSSIRRNSFDLKIKEKKIFNVIINFLELFFSNLAFDK